MNAIHEVYELGQSFWYDNIEKKLLIDGTFTSLIESGEIKGVTSNPTIFQKAIANSNDYNTAINKLALLDSSEDILFNHLAINDIQIAADTFLVVYEETHGVDGYVSLEVNPLHANDTQATIKEAQQLWQQVNRPNLMIKIPATLEGLPAITETIANGINVNVTLIFSLKRYAAVIDAYLSGLEKRVQQNLQIHSIASVASFFVSRVDTKVDAQLEILSRHALEKAGLIHSLYGKAALANSRLAYFLFQDKFSSQRFHTLESGGAARLQRPLWASTSTKNKQYSDVVYVEGLIAPNTVNTVPPATLDAFRDHGKADLTIENTYEESLEVMEQLRAVGIDMDVVTKELEEEGVKAFADSYSSLLQTLKRRMQLLTRSR
jgi:transaldolase